MGIDADVIGNRALDSPQVWAGWTVHHNTPTKIVFNGHRARTTPIQVDGIPRPEPHHEVPTFYGRHPLTETRLATINHNKE